MSNINKPGEWKKITRQIFRVRNTIWKKYYDRKIMKNTHWYPYINCHTEYPLTVIEDGESCQNVTVTCCVLEPDIETKEVLIMRDWNDIDWSTWKVNK